MGCFSSLAASSRRSVQDKISSASPQLSMRLQGQVRNDFLDILIVFGTDVVVRRAQYHVDFPVVLPCRGDLLRLHHFHQTHHVLQVTAWGPSNNL